MGEIQPSLGHYLDQIAKAELVAQVPPHANDDHLAIELPPCKHYQSMIVPALMIHYAFAMAIQ